MKKLSTLLIVLALVLGFTQCKKKIETVASTPSTPAKVVHITLDVNGGKHDVNPNTGAVTYTTGDKIYVGNNGHYIGILEYQSGAFSGNITNPSSEDYLHFFFVSNLATSNILPPSMGGSSLRPGTTVSFKVDISNQGTALPVLSYNRSTEKYSDETTTYSSTLLNKCGLVKFTLDASTDATVKVCNMLTEAMIDFANNSITPTGKRDAITLKAFENENERWAILLPQNAVTAGLAIIGDNYYNCSVQAVSNNSYITTGNTISNTTPITDRFFTVSANGNAVRFSPGNLQYLPNENKWRFAPHQYDMCVTESQLTPTYTYYIPGLHYYILNEETGDYDEVDEIEYQAYIDDGGENCYCESFDTEVTEAEYDTYIANGGENSYVETEYTCDVSSQYVATGTDWIDLLGWGTWTGTNPNPLKTTQTDDYTWDDADFVQTIINDPNTGWHTPSVYEWGYITGLIGMWKGNRYRDCDHRFLKANISVGDDNYYGMIIFPDSFDNVVETLGLTGSYTYNDEHNDFQSVNADDWALMESVGAVFLPSGGYRVGNFVYNNGWGNLHTGEYSSKTSAFRGYYGMHFSSINAYTDGGAMLCSGYSVRLVR